MAPDGRTAIVCSAWDSRAGTHDIFLARFSATEQSLPSLDVTLTNADEGEPKVESDRFFNLVVGWRTRTSTMRCACCA